MSIILNFEIRKSNLRSHVTNEMSAVCVAVKTAYVLRTEELSKCVPLDVNLAPGSSKFSHHCCMALNRRVNVNEELGRM
jgi:hypothetical protein